MEALTLPAIEAPGILFGIRRFREAQREDAARHWQLRRKRPRPVSSTALTIASEEQQEVPYGADWLNPVLAAAGWGFGADTDVLDRVLATRPTWFPSYSETHKKHTELAQLQQELEDIQAMPATSSTPRPARSTQSPRVQHLPPLAHPGAGQALSVPLRAPTAQEGAQSLALVELPHDDEILAGVSASSVDVTKRAEGIVREMCNVVMPPVAHRRCIRALAALFATPAGGGRDDDHGAVAAAVEAAALRPRPQDEARRMRLEPSCRDDSAGRDRGHWLKCPHELPEPSEPPPPQQQCGVGGVAGSSGEEAALPYRAEPRSIDSMELQVVAATARHRSLLAQVACTRATFLRAWRCHRLAIERAQQLKQETAEVANELAVLRAPTAWYTANGHRWVRENASRTDVPVSSEVWFRKNRTALFALSAFVAGPAAARTKCLVRLDVLDGVLTGVAHTVDSQREAQVAVVMERAKSRAEAAAQLLQVHYRLWALGRHLRSLHVCLDAALARLAASERASTERGRQWRAAHAAAARDIQRIARGAASRREAERRRAEQDAAEAAAIRALKAQRAADRRATIFLDDLRAQLTHEREAALHRRQRGARLQAERLRAETETKAKAAAEAKAKAKLRAEAEDRIMRDARRRRATRETLAIRSALGPLGNSNNNHVHGHGHGEQDRGADPRMGGGDTPIGSDGGDGGSGDGGGGGGGGGAYTSLPRRRHALKPRRDRTVPNTGTVTAERASAMALAMGRLLATTPKPDKPERPPRRALSGGDDPHGVMPSVRLGGEHMAAAGGAVDLASASAVGDDSEGHNCLGPCLHLVETSSRNLFVERARQRWGGGGGASTGDGGLSEGSPQLPFCIPLSTLAPLVLGRSGKCDVRIDSRRRPGTIGKRHAKIYVTALRPRLANGGSGGGDGGAIFDEGGKARPAADSDFLVAVRDLASRNGTYINGKSIVGGEGSASPSAGPGPGPGAARTAGNTTAPPVPPQGVESDRRVIAATARATARASAVFPLHQGDTLALGFIAGRDGRPGFSDVVYRLSGLLARPGDPHPRPDRAVLESLPHGPHPHSSSSPAKTETGK